MPLDNVKAALYSAYAAEVFRRGRKFIADEYTRDHLYAVAEWLVDANSKVGIMLSGLHGNGKTTTLMAVCNLINYLYNAPQADRNRSIRIVKAKNIAMMAVDRERRREFENLFTEELLAIDELGEEPAEILHFGMIYTPLRDLLEERYARQKFTIITTNLTQSEKSKQFQLRDHYGERVVDRLREMMKVVPFHNPSYRVDPATVTPQIEARG